MLKKKFKSFAKINLFLNVGKKFNKTGLHNIQSLVCLINLFDGIISDSDEKLINAKIKNVLNNSISKDFDGLVSVLNNFDFSSETSKISLLSIINLITPNLSVSDSLDNEWKETLLLSKKTISLKIRSISEESDLRFIAQISQWIEKDNTFQRN